MIERLQNTIYTGQKIDDFQCFHKLPDYLKDFYTNQNGCIVLNGGFHIRGCVLNPQWHSLGNVWFGSLKLSDLFDSLSPNDIPIAQDCFGDQYLIREDKVIKLSAESGDIEFFEKDLFEFLELVKADPIEILNFENIDQFDLKPGQLLSVFPPFCINSDSDISIKPIDYLDRILFLSNLSQQVKKFPDGTNLEIELS